MINILSYKRYFMFPGRGGKRISFNININRLFLDGKNPRFFNDMENKSEFELYKHMFSKYQLEELASSISENGYFDEEPLIAIPKKLPKEFEGIDFIELQKKVEYKEFLEKDTTKFIVVEGNRRLSTIKILLNVDGLKDNLGASFFPEIKSKELIDDISNPFVVIYPTRKDVSKYLAVKHITGPKKWEPYSKARFLDILVEEKKEEFPGKNVNEILKMVSEEIGDTSQSTKKLYINYKLIQQFKNISDEKYNESENFSYLDISISNGNFKEYLGLPDALSKIEDYENIVPKEKYENLKNIFRWYFGVGSNDGNPIFTDSRDIQSKFLPKILPHSKALEILDYTKNISLALEEISTNLKYVKEQLSNFAVKSPNIYEKLAGILEDKNEIGKITNSDFDSFIKNSATIRRQIKNIESLLEEYKDRF